MGWFKAWGGWTARAMLAACALFSLSTILYSGLATSAFAESAHSTLDANGVDLVDGTFNLRLPVASIGSGQGALALIIYDSQFDNWSGLSVSRTVSGGVTTMTVDLARGYDQFSSSDGYAVSKLGTGATLTVHSNEWVTYTTLDGTSIEFKNLSPNNTGGTSSFCDSYNTVNCRLLPETIDRRGGMTVSYGWDIEPNCTTPTVPGGPVNCSEYWRLASVTNDAGYVIAWTFVNASGPPVAAWFQRATATLSNINVSSTTPPTVTYAYPSASVMTVTTPGGKTWRLTGNPGALTGVRRPTASSDTTTISYSGGVVTSVTSDGVTTGYSRSVSGSTATTTVTNVLSQTSTVVADLTRQRVTAITDPLSHTTTMSYTSVGRPTDVTYPEGNKVQYGYDSRGNVTSTTLVAKSGSGLSNIVISASYPSTCVDAACNQPVTTTDARSQVTDYAYDGTTGVVTSVTAPAASGGATRPQTRYSYTTVSGVAMVTATSTCRTGSAPSCVGTADEVKASTSYNGNLLPTSVSRGSGDGLLTATTAATYDAVGNVVTIDGPLAGADDTTTLRWSADRERLGVISPDPDGAGARKRRALKTTYNGYGAASVSEVGTVTGTSDADWAAFVSLQQSTASYDANARRTKDVTTAGGTTYGVTQYGYDALGRPECAALRMNAAAWGSLPSSACTLGTTGGYGPDRIAKTSYDADGRVTRQQSAYGTSDQADEAVLTYSANGRLATVTDANTNTTTYEYDGFDRLAKTRYPVTTAGSGTSSTTDYEQLSYDAASAVTNRRLRDGTSIGYAYDNLGRLTTKDLPGSEPDVDYGYDLLGALVSAQAGTLGDTLAWDALGRLTQEAQPFGTMAYQYDVAGRRTRATWPGGFYVEYDHLVTGETTAVRENGATSGIGVLATFGYDDLGQRTSLTRGNGTVTTYNHDAVSRLSSLAQDLGGTAADLTLGYGYTPASQITGVTRSNDAYAWGSAVPRNDSSTANGLNQVTNVGAGSIGYDARGNLTSAGSTSYAYTAENMLKSASGGTTLYYDAFLRLIEYDTSVSTRFVYDGAAMTAEIDGASGGMTRRYVFGPGVDEPLVEYDAAGTRTWLHADERGSIIARSDVAGTVTKINSYDEYGVPAPRNAGRFGYTGQAWLPTGAGAAGLWYYKARMYAPALGRFLQTDPIGYDSGMNLYAYVGGDPVNFTDPSGLCYRAVIDNKELSIEWYPCPSGGGSGGSGNNGWGSQQNYDLPNDAAPTQDQAQVGDEVVVTAKRICGFLCQIGRFLGIAKNTARSTVCTLPSVSYGGGADGYAGVGASLGGAYNVDLAKGRFGISASLAVGVGLGVGVGNNVGWGPSGGGVVSANLMGSAGFAALPVFPGVTVGGQGSYNFIGTDPGYSGSGISRGGTPLVYANGGANIGFSTPPLYNLGC